MGRAHKSNGIFIMVDLQVSGSTLPLLRGTSTSQSRRTLPSAKALGFLQAEVWRQRCYDEECSNYQSPAVPVPAEVLR